MGNKILEIQNIKREFKVGTEMVRALKGISFDVNAGEFVTIMGSSGSGKTTLLAAGCRMLIERPAGCGKLLTYEAPIEYVYDAVVCPRSVVAQSRCSKRGDLIALCRPMSLVT